VIVLLELVELVELLELPELQLDVLDPLELETELLTDEWLEPDEPDEPDDLEELPELELERLLCDILDSDEGSLKRVGLIGPVYGTPAWGSGTWGVAFHNR
jgi:hypothetical protein